MLLELDLASRREAHPQQLIAHSRAELGLGQEQELVLTSPPDPQRRYHPCLGREQERIATPTGREARNVVGEHPLEVVLGGGAGDTDERTRTPGNRARGSRRDHAVSVRGQLRVSAGSIASSIK